ncbi:hypothetical protein PFICI_09453 [Pestalotiopsis fici W106-1]|uniref:GDP/GTP exchange factor Sec2 N-terminal domain-containing protein n=1 Tax=Pestalotiopsis fici (strain W106-1 / CGMCC3.15140) TaxID=1229662 RepID=W3X0H6_PESFW|nr:uncharacterized protein PFICI_09453 [Pestalotiopsis fici W106-1]ETS79600.1 hypothetical protein PFICI_09453 [Pestalotiopsis fici W106-1]
MTVSQSPKKQPPTMAAAPCCPNCGTSLDSSEVSSNSSDPTAALLAAQKQIADLQAQVRLLNQKAAAAVDRWADYEDELTRLRAASSATNTTVTTTTTTGALSATTSSSQYPPRSHTPSQSQGALSTASATSPRASFLNAGASRISALLSPRSKAAAAAQQQQQNLNSTAGGPRASLSTGALPLMSPKSGLPSPAPSTDDLLEALSREQGLRLAAEGKLDETSKEVEELSATLFEQANEMVATERKARARLEERVEVLEKRDEEKRNRLERLEGAMGRIERVNRLLKD